MSELILVLDTTKAKKCPYMREIRGITHNGERIFKCCKVIDNLCDGWLNERPKFCPLVEVGNAKKRDS